MSESDKTLFSTSEITDMEAQVEKLENKLTILNRKQTELDRKDLGNVKKNIDGAGVSIGNVINKMGRWLLAIFAIESAYGFVRQSISTLSQYNKQIGTDVAYIQYALATMVQPIIEGLIKLVYKLLSYINYIAKAWFGVNLFANASSKAFQKAQKSTSKMSKDTKDIAKNLANGIDEITNLDDKEDTSGGNLDEGIQAPSFDLGNMEDIKIPNWLQWIADHKDEIIKGLLGIAGGLLAIKLGATGLQGLGIGIIIVGIYNLIKDILDLLKDPQWEKFNNILKDTSLIIIGIGLIFGNLPIIIAGAMGLILSYVIEHWEQIEQTFENGKNKIHEIFQSLFGNTMFADLFEGNFVWPLEFGFSRIKGFVLLLKNVFQAFAKFMKGDFSGGIKTAIKGIGNYFIGILNSIISAINGFLTPFRSIIAGVGRVVGKKWTINDIKIPKVPHLAKGGIVNKPGPGVNMGNYVAGERGAEAILPLENSKFINDFANEVAGKMNDSTIIDLLIELNRSILELANRPTTLNVNGEELARVTYEDFQNEEKRQQNSTVVVKR